jgi:hypothetical protein
VKAPDPNAEQRFVDVFAESRANQPAPIGRTLLVCGAVAALGALVTVWFLKPGVAVAALIGSGAAVVACGSTSLLCRRKRVQSSPQRALCLSPKNLSFDAGQGEAPVVVADLENGFGFTLLANRARTVAAMVITTEHNAFYVSTSFSTHERAEQRPLLSRAFTVASDERALESAAPDGESFLVSPQTFSRLHQSLLLLDQRSQERIFTIDARGDQIRLDNDSLNVGKLSFDLASKLEWRGLLFREGGDGTTVFQGTYLRQQEREVVFVALMPALSTPTLSGDMTATNEPELERAVVRDMELLRVNVDEPPPNSQRVAIERIFMLPLRAALHHAALSSTLAPEDRSKPPDSLGAS